MTTEKKCLPEFKLYKGVKKDVSKPDAYDLSKKWFVHYTHQKKRVKVFRSINQFHTYEKRLAEAKRVIAQLKIEYQPPPPDIVVQLWANYSTLSATWNHMTRISYKSMLNTFLDFAAADGVSQTTLDAFFRWLQEKRSAATHNIYLRTLRLLFRDCEGFGSEFDFTRYKRMKTNSKPARYFQTSQIAMIKAHLLQHAPELWHLVQFQYYCFIRPNEARQLRAGDILLDDRKILVRSDISKNSKAQYVSIPDAFYPDVTYTASMRPSDWLFPTRSGVEAHKGKCISRNAMSGKHKLILRELGFSDEYCLYSWKHTGAVMAVKAGIGLKELQIQLRHHSLEMVEKYLRQLGVDDLSNLAEKFPKI